VYGLTRRLEALILEKDSKAWSFFVSKYSKLKNGEESEWTEIKEVWFRAF
jgi:hypothetical protein